jgi:hypothetical protein
MPGFQAFLEVTEDGDAAVGFANSTRGLRGELGASLLAILAAEEPRSPSDWEPVAPPAGAMEIVGPWYWGVAPHVLRARHELLELDGLGGPGRAARFRPAGEDTWEGLDGYHTAEPLRVVRRPDGTVSHLDLGSFIFSRTPYDPSAPIPGGVDPQGWGPSEHRTDAP